MAENLNLKTVDTVDTRPFKRLVMTIGELPTSFIESMTYYELLAWFVNYLETVIIPTVNNNAEAVKELQVLFTELKGFVDNYFDNLDVQEEINNKLDEMADSGELADIITEYYANHTDVIFPTYDIDGTDTLGDCSIIKTQNKAIMIDIFANDADLFGGIVSALSENNISKIDYLIISHFDSDHIGNYQRLINSGLINDARIILPRAVDNEHIHMTGADIKAALTAAGLTWEDADNETIQIDDDVSIRIFNASAADYAYYDSIGTENYNNYSIFVELNAHGKKALFSGDALGTASDYVAENYIYESGYDLVKDNHHGFCTYSVDYSKKVAPKNVLIPASAGMIKANLGYRGGMRASWSLYTDSIYYQGCQDEPVRFRLSHDGVIVNSNVYTSTEPGTDAVFDYYIDATTSDQLRTGSAEHPFKNLAEANAMSPKNSVASVKFNVIHLGNETTQVIFNCYKQLQINFNENIPKNNLTFKNIGMLRLNDVKLDSSIITIEDCPSVLITDLESSAAVNDQISITRSKVQFDGVLTSTNAIYSFIKVTYSEMCLAFTTLNFTQASNNARLLSAWQNNITCATATTTILKALPFTSQIVTRNNAKQNNWNNLYDLCTLFESDTTTYTGITLQETINNYRSAIVECFTDEGYALTVQFDIHSGNNYYCASSGYTNGAGTGYYERVCRIKLNATSAETDRQAQLNMDSGVVPTITVKNVIGIRKVIGVL